MLFKGSGWANLQQGEKISKIDQIKPGDVILEESHQLNARNVVKVTSCSKNSIRGYFVNPANHTEKRQASDQEFVIWDYHFELGGSLYFKAMKKRGRPRKKA